MKISYSILPPRWPKPTEYLLSFGIVGSVCALGLVFTVGIEDIQVLPVGEANGTLLVRAAATARLCSVASGLAAGVLALCLHSVWLRVARSRKARKARAASAPAPTVGPSPQGHEANLVAKSEAAESQRPRRDSPAGGARSWAGASAEGRAAAEREKLWVVLTAGAILYLIECAFQEAGAALVRELGIYFAIHAAALLAKSIVLSRKAATDAAMARLFRWVVIATLLTGGVAVVCIYAPGSALDTTWLRNMNAAGIGAVTAMLHLVPLERFRRATAPS